jgi:hypothetical protein
MQTHHTISFWALERRSYLPISEDTWLLRCNELVAVRILRILHDLSNSSHVEQYERFPASSFGSGLA